MLASYSCVFREGKASADRLKALEATQARLKSEVSAAVSDRDASKTAVDKLTATVDTLQKWVPV